MAGLSPLAISLNFDSLNEAYGFPPGFRDVSFFAAFDRLAELAAKYALPLSIYIIGKDLEHPEHAARVREWHAAGHEIGNHTWSHDASLGAKPMEVIRSEIEQAHARIAEVTGEAPKGFIAPSWSTSRGVIGELIRLGYRYDSSVFPSVFMYALLAKSYASHLGNAQKRGRVAARRDWELPLLSPLEPYLVDAGFHRCKKQGQGQLLMMPLPAWQRWRVPCWHTAGFFFGWDRLYRSVERLSREREGFYYLIHPADFLAPEDLSGEHQQHLERMDVPVVEKLRRLEEVFQILAKSPRGVATMQAKAEALRAGI
ncbi:MAG: polysaccharide deacetylase family protein [Rickettsiales bacterium]|nr:polysaccharide deacetylase family protein [Rickettsiales bacterium]